MDALANYLRNHWAASAGGGDLAARVARSHRGTDLAAELDALAVQVVEDREALRGLMDRVGVGPDHLGALAARAGERVGRLKPNGRLVRHSPVSDVLEIEALHGAITAKSAGWEALRVLAPQDDRLPDARLAELQERASDQLERLSAVHRTLVARRLPPSAND